MTFPARFHAPADAAVADAFDALGELPEWNLNDLYPGMDSPELKRDLQAAEARSAEFQLHYKGKLVDMAKGPDAGRKLAGAVVAY